MANNSFGIDLGTNNIKIYSRNDDNIMIEKNMIAIENKHNFMSKSICAGLFNNKLVALVEVRDSFLSPIRVFNH